MPLFQSCNCHGFFSATIGKVVTLNILRLSETQNSAGEMVLSYADIGPVTGTYEPGPTGMIRQLESVTVAVDHRLFVMGTVDVRERDRALLQLGYMSAEYIEALRPRFFDGYMEIDWKDLGR